MLLSISVAKKNVAFYQAYQTLIWLGPRGLDGMLSKQKSTPLNKRVGSL